VGEEPGEENMTGQEGLEVVANVASIVTAIVAAFAWGYYRCDLHRKRVALENHLKDEKEKGLVKKDKDVAKKRKGREIDRGQRTVRHLTAALAMTKDDVLRAAFDSKHVATHVKTKDGYADKLLFEYSETPKSQ
jgi:hypothetical protein